MSLRKYSYSTISGHVSAISYICKLNSWTDNTKQFVIKSLLEGLRRTRKSHDARRPVTKETLIKLIKALGHVCRSQYETILFSAAFSLAYIALLRISEFTVKNARDRKCILSNDSIILGTDTIRLYFSSSKTDQKRFGTHVDIHIDGENRFCYNLVQNFLNYRPKSPGPLFCHFDGNPLSAYQFNAVLKMALNFAGLKDCYFKSHSFRIGGATSMFKNGRQIEEIKQRGRWQSNAYKSYIRS